ncbi:FeoA family protein [Eubacterium xylanophilum]|uniref:FeoA family protein n=1 Tax=Eubacterium xylanophilum TaxID=39497 RepID=UPI0004AF2AF8|nr:ferrous iron transport protein A [Eubacterium xylanophilum]
MKKLSELQKGSDGIVVAINGDKRFISRITSIGLTPGCKSCQSCMPKEGFQNMGTMWEI